MTTLAAWVSYQNKKPVALNIASDSRFTWGSEDVRWDSGRKIFWCKRGVEIFGYAGDVVTQSNVLSQLCEVVDYSRQFGEMGSGDRHAAFVDLVEASVDAQVDVPKRGMTIFHGTRSDDAGAFPFRLWKTSFDETSGSWEDEEHMFPLKLDVSENDKKVYSDVALAAGSGASKFRSRKDENFSKYGCSARSVFQALVHAIGPEGDPLSGGHAQAVTLGIAGPPSPIGFYMGGKCSLAGMVFGEAGAGGDIDWRDENFEYIDSSSLHRKSGAPKHWFW